MTAQRSETPDPGEIDWPDESAVLARVKRLTPTITRSRNASIAMLAGSVLLVYAIRSVRRNRRRAVVSLLASAALLAMGFRQRRSGDSAPAAEGGVPTPDDEAEKVSDEAHAARERADVMHQPETNPRGTSGEPDVEAKTDPDEGELQFSDTQDTGPGSEPRLEETPEDPRFEDEEEVDIDLSEAAMADEASEATGPDPEQAQPTQTEDTEPEESPAEDASHVQADAPDEEDEESVAEAEGDLSEEE